MIGTVVASLLILIKNKRYVQRVKLIVANAFKTGILFSLKTGTPVPEPVGDTSLVYCACGWCNKLITVVQLYSSTAECCSKCCVCAVTGLTAHRDTKLAEPLSCVF